MRAVDLTMTEYAYSPTTIEVARGETVSFHFTNSGKLLHEAFVGSEAEQEEHESLIASESQMSDMAGMDHSAHLAGDAMLRVAAGRSGTLVHTFDEPGTYVIGCHQTGHWAAGMRATVVVS